MLDSREEAGNSNPKERSSLTNMKPPIIFTCLVFSLPITITLCASTITKEEYDGFNKASKAITEGNLDDLKKTVTETGSITKKEIYGNTLLIEASSSGNDKILEYLLDTDSSLINHFSPFNGLPIFAAVGAKNLHAVKALVAKGANLKILVNDDSILRDAVFYGADDILEFLLQQSAGRALLYQVDSRGYRPLGLAVKKQNIKAVKLLLAAEKEAGGVMSGIEQAYGSILAGMLTPTPPPFHLAVESGNREIIKLLIEGLPAEINSHDANGATPLHYALVNERFDIFNDLIAAGADPTAKAKLVTWKNPTFTGFRSDFSNVTVEELAKQLAEKFPDKAPEFNKAAEAVREAIKKNLEKKPSPSAPQEEPKSDIPIEKEPQDLAKMADNLRQLSNAFRSLHGTLTNPT